MLLDEYEGFLTYAIWLCAGVALLSLVRWRKRGASVLFLTGGCAAFALMLHLIRLRASEVWIYATGFVVALSLVLDFLSRKDAHPKA